MKLIHKHTSSLGTAGTMWLAGAAVAVLADDAVIWGFLLGAVASSLALIVGAAVEAMHANRLERRLKGVIAASVLRSANNN